MMQRETFEAYGAEGYNLVPLWRRIDNRGWTPSTVYRCLAGNGDDYLFETGGFRDGRFVPGLSCIGLACEERIELTGGQVRVLHRGQVVQETYSNDPLNALRERLAAFRVPRVEGLPALAGGLFGYFGFETVRMIEPRLARTPRKPAAVEMPDVVQLLSRELVVIDHAAGSVFCVVYAEPGVAGNHERAIARLESMVAAVRALQREAPPAVPEVSSAVEAGVRHHFQRRDFKAAVGRIKEYIEAGDVMQVVLSQPMSRRLDAGPLDFYRALTAINPSPYSYLLNLGERQVVGASPEMLVKRRGDRVESRPMAGTRRRGTVPAEDAALERELLSDAKERAEHVMLIDLARNDLGRVAATGSVRVEECMTVEHFSHVMHIVSTVSARVAPGLDAVDLLKATFPAGTLSGASKIRVLEVINELEPASRGVYGGAVGLLDWFGGLDVAIAIRTAVLGAGELHLQAGAGVVADSQAEREWQETLEKSRALLTAAGLAESLAGPTPARGEEAVCSW